MEDQVVRLGIADFDDTMAMMARAFSEHSEHDFPAMFPGLYRPTEEVMARHLGIRRDGRIVASVGIMPINWQIGDARLPVAGIAGVATDPPSRGCGLMRRIMEHAVTKMRDSGCALSHLGGERQRYARFGWEVAGTEIKMQMKGKNIASVDSSGLQFSPLAERGDAFDQARHLHEAAMVRCHRSETSFHAMLRNWDQVPHAACDAAGCLAGYVVTDKIGTTVTELIAVDTDQAMRVIAAWVRTRQEAVTLWLDRYDVLLARRLGALAQCTTISSSGNWQILDWWAVVDAIWRLWCQQAPLPPGSVVLGIEGQGRNLRLALDERKAVCEHTDKAADLTADAATMMRVLFGPMDPASVVPIPAEAAVLQAWCPLPLSLPGPDRV